MGKENNNLIHNTGMFEEEVLSTLSFILNVEKPCGIPLNYDDLEIKTGIIIRNKTLIFTKLNYEYYNHITIIHTPTKCEIDIINHTFDLHNTLCLALSELVKSVDKFNKEFNGTKEEELSVKNEEESSSDKSKFNFNKWKEMLKGIFD